MELTFFGASQEVTGSNFLLETANTKILIDCGLLQGGRFVNPENYQPFPFDATAIDAVFITHAHIDHTGKIPKLYKDGFRGTIHSTAPTKDFAEQLLMTRNTFSVATRLNSISTRSTASTISTTP